MISVGGYGYTSNGECYYVVAHAEGKHIAFPVYESEGGELIDFDEARTISKLFEEAPESKKSEEVLKLSQELKELREQKNALSLEKSSITNDIARLKREHDEIDELFPFLKEALRIKRGEKLFFVKRRGYAEYIWGKVEPEWGRESEMSATLTLNRRNGEINIYGSPKLCETEEQAKEAAQRLTIEDLQNYPPSEREYYPLAKYINLARIDRAIEELKQKAAELDGCPAHQPKDTTNA